MLRGVKTREDKRDVLKKNDSWSLKAILQQNFHPEISKWLIPPYTPPYNENQTSADTSLMFEIKEVRILYQCRTKIPM